MSTTTKTFKETEEDTIYYTTKIYTVLSFAIIIIVIGIPLWWKTTETYRVSLPFSKIDELRFGEAFTTNVTVVIPSNLESYAVDKLLNKELAAGSMNNIYYSVETISSSDLKRLQKSSSFNEFSEFLYSTGRISTPGKLFVFILPHNAISFPFNKKFYVAQRRVMFTLESSDVLSMLSDIKAVLADVLVRQSNRDAALIDVIYPQKTKPDKATLWTMRTTPAYDVAFSLIVPNPAEVQAQWDIEQGVQTFLQPMLEKLKPIAEFNVQSQVLYYISLGVIPKFDSSKNWSYLTFEQLPHTINPLEAKLGSHISINPNFNFLIYLPKKSESPLYIYDENGKLSQTNAFSSPRWGGIYIYNLPTPSMSSSSQLQRIEIDMRKVMEVFISELRIFLGLNTLISDEQIEYENFGSSCLSDWEIDFLLHKRTIENLATSVNTLKTLSALLGEIGNIVINDEVGSYVKNSLEAIARSQHHLRESSLTNAFAFSKEAFISSENAFFDPSMLALLYFPDDQKYAVYVPLFLPVSVPVILSLIQLYKAWKSRRETKIKTE